MRHILIGWLFVLGVLLSSCGVPTGGSSPATGGDSSTGVTPPGGVPEKGGPAPTPDPGGGSGGAGQSGILTAGDIDDNLNFAAYLKYQSSMLQADTSQTLPSVPLGNRVTVRVLDDSSKGVANARVKVFTDTNAAPIFEGTAGADGHFRFFPTLDGGKDATQFTVQARPANADTPTANVIVDLKSMQPSATFEAKLNGLTAPTPAALDLMLVIDATGSMGDEMKYLSAEFQDMVSRIKSQFPSVSTRFSLIVYRDEGDEYVVRSFDFTDSADTLRGQLAQQVAAGGGDYPEAMDQAIDKALKGQWRTGNTARLVFLVADAPPHDAKLNVTLEHAKAARRAGLRFYPLAASGVADTAEYMMRAMATITHGRYLFLTNDSGVGNPKAEPKIPCYNTTRLDQLMVRVIASELSGARVEPSKDQIIRTVGKPEAGVCVQ